MAFTKIALMSVIAAAMFSAVLGMERSLEELREDQQKFTEFLKDLDQRERTFLDFVKKMLDLHLAKEPSFKDITSTVKEGAGSARPSEFAKGFSRILNSTAWQEAMDAINPRSRGQFKRKAGLELRTTKLKVVVKSLIAERVNLEKSKKNWYTKFQEVKSKVSITSGQTAAIVLNTAKTGITSGQASANVANTAKTGITSGQASANVENTAKTTCTGIPRNMTPRIINILDVTNLPDLPEDKSRELTNSDRHAFRDERNYLWRNYP